MAHRYLLHSVVVSIALAAQGVSPLAESAARVAPDIDYLNLDLEQLMEISISTATKRQQQLKHIPASVTVIYRHDIESQGYSSLPELFRNLAGTYLLDDTQDISIGMRGNAAGSIQVLLNGIPLDPTQIKGLTLPERSQFNIPIEAIDSVEIIRGPMSVIYGNNAFKGAINIITNDLGSTGSLLNASVGDHRNSLFARYGKQYRDGFWVVNWGANQESGFDGAYEDMMSTEQYSALHPDMHRTMDGDFKRDAINLDLSTRYANFSGDLRYSKMRFGSYALTPSFNDGNQQEDTNLITSTAYDKTLSDNWRLRAQGVYSEHKVAIDQLDFISPVIYASKNYQQQQSKRGDIELNSIYDNNASFEILLGYRYQSLFDTQRDVSVPSIGLDFFLKNEPIQTHDLFFQASWQLNKKIMLVAGNRWTHANEYTSTSFNRNSNETTTVKVHANNSNYSVPNIAVIFSLNKHNAIKLLYGEALQDNQDLAFSRPENLNTYELNYVFTKPKFTVNFSLFNAYAKNLFRFSHRFNSQTQRYEDVADNHGKTSSEGAEIILDYQPSDKVNVQTSVVWQHSDDTQYTHITSGYSPERLFKSKLSYQHNHINYALSFYYLSHMYADYRYLDSTTIGDYQRIGDEIGATTSININLRYAPRPKGFFAQLHIENLTDEEIRYPAVELIDLQHGLMEVGRSVAISGGWKF